MSLSIDEETLNVLRGDDLTEPIAALIEHHRRAVEQLPAIEAQVLWKGIHELAQSIDANNGSHGQLAAKLELVQHHLSQLGIGVSRGAPVVSRKSWQVRWSDIVFQTDAAGQRKVLGEGAFGRVFAATYKGVPVAVKQFVRAGVESRLDYFKQEVGALSRLRHPAIIHFYGATLRNPGDPDDPSEYAIVMERGAMTLLEAMNVMREPEFSFESSVPLPRAIDDKLKMLQSLADGLRYLHLCDPPIVLQDIKPSNVILTADGKAKFIDFGFATVKATTVNTRSRIFATDDIATPVRVAHTPQYAAPEVIDGLVRQPKVEQDIYSFGLLCYELLTGAPRVVDDARCDLHWSLELPDDCGVEPHIAGLVAACTAPEARNRPTAHQVYDCIAFNLPVYYNRLREVPIKDVNSHFWLTIDGSSTRLCAACLRGDSFTVNQVLGSPEATSSIVNATNNFGATALHAACQTGSDGIVKELLMNGADVNRAANDGTTPLVVACLNRRVKVVQRLLEAGADVNAADKDGFTPLCAAFQAGSVVISRTLMDAGGTVDGKKLMKVACTNNNIECVKLLVKRDVDVDAFLDDDKTTPLMVAAAFGLTNLIRWLLNQGAQLDAHNRLGQTALHFALLSDQPDALRMLLGKGANVDAADNFSGRTALHYAASNCLPEVVATLLKGGANVDAADRSGNTPLHYAAENDHGTVVKLLCQSDACVNARGRSGATPLHLAAEKGQTNAIAALVEANVDVVKTDDNGRTPLHLAAQHGRVAVIAALLESSNDAAVGDGSDTLAQMSTKVILNAVDKNGETPLHYAAEKNHSDFVTMVVAVGADVDCAANSNWTPLHGAAWWGHAGVVSALLEGRANVNAVSKGGQTPLHYAAAKGHHDVSTLLLEANANRDATDNHGDTPLHCASWCGSSPIVASLLRAGAKVKHAKDGKTPLNVASNIDVVRLLSR